MYQLKIAIFFIVLVTLFRCYEYAHNKEKNFKKLKDEMSESWWNALWHKIYAAIMSVIVLGWIWDKYGWDYHVMTYGIFIGSLSWIVKDMWYGFLHSKENVWNILFYYGKNSAIDKIKVSAYVKTAFKFVCLFVGIYLINHTELSMRIWNNVWSLDGLLSAIILLVFGTIAYGFHHKWFSKE